MPISAELWVLKMSFFTGLRIGFYQIIIINFQSAGSEQPSGFIKMRWPLLDRMLLLTAIVLNWIGQKDDPIHFYYKISYQKMDLAKIVQKLDQMFAIFLVFMGLLFIGSWLRNYVQVSRKKIIRKIYE